LFSSALMAEENNLSLKRRDLNTTAIFLARKIARGWLDKLLRRQKFSRNQIPPSPHIVFFSIESILL